MGMINGKTVFVMTLLLTLIMSCAGCLGVGRDRIIGNWGTTITGSGVFGTSLIVNADNTFAGTMFGVPLTYGVWRKIDDTHYGFTKTGTIYEEPEYILVMSDDALVFTDDKFTATWKRTK